MILSSYFFHSISSLWLQLNNVDYEITVVLFTVSLLLLAGAWTAWISKNTPPLPPGPRGLPLVGNLPFLDPELHTCFQTLAQAYGPIVRLQLGTKVGVVISSPAAAREVLRDNDATFANRDVPELAIDAVAKGHSDIVFSPHGPGWQMLRKVCVREVLGSATLESVYGLRRREIRNTVRYLHSQVGSPVNVGEHMFLTALNAITSMLWGVTMKEEERTRIGVDFRVAVAEAMELLGKPNLSDFFPGLAWFDLQGLKKQMMGLVGRFNKIFDAITDRGLGLDGGKESRDFLQVLLQLKNEGDAKTPLTMTQLKVLFMDMVLGGTETTSNAIEFAMAEMMNKPEILKKAQQELDMVVGKDSIVEESHINKLPYLNAILKEVLRLHPVLPLMVPHCPSQTCIIGGYTIPKGTRVFINIWAIHRDPLIWENPAEFHPERFLDGKLGFRGGDFSYFPFGSGRRMCAGIAMAERMFLFSLASILHSFEWKLPEGEELDLSEKFGIVLKKRVPLVAIPTARLSNPALYD
ncbi:flavonoid 3'-monooxygenase CYP75B137-like [Rhododendron vialii]|uniref:flavonoid 3'-monooxygenase CYP75B137-like n=1 Tax=Rhododendron vialii TaxID=182163 RepID=UPI00265DEF28|nr:flavonoid 3'-monooxygenase CYP75B137-like [Rhododendron vialii]